MKIEVRNLATQESRRYRERSPQAAVLRATVEDRTNGYPVRTLREMWLLRKTIREGARTVYCGNWMASLPARERGRA